MKVSILCPIHRYGGLDMLFDGLSKQTFPKSEYELILCDKLYNFRKYSIESISIENRINIKHFEPKNKSKYHVHSSILNECLEKASGEYCIVIGDYTYMSPHWIDIHYQYNVQGYGLTAPQCIYMLPKLHKNLERPISIFYNKFNIEMFKILPQISMDPKLSVPIGTIMDHRFCYNRNESFLTEKAREIGGWDESYNERVGPSNKEFYLRLINQCNYKFATDSRATIYRIMSYSIPPFTNFKDEEINDKFNMSKYKELCKKYGVNE